MVADKNGEIGETLILGTPYSTVTARVVGWPHTRNAFKISVVKSVSERLFGLDKYVRVSLKEILETLLVNVYNCSEFTQNVTLWQVL